MESLKNNANRIVGTKQVLRAVKAGKLQRVYVANDVDTFLYQQVQPTSFRGLRNFGDNKLEVLPCQRSIS